MKCVDVKNNINFKTNYNFVSSIEAFEKAAKGGIKFCYDTHPNVDKLYTYDVRTCSAGVIINESMLSFGNSLKKLLRRLIGNKNLDEAKRAIGFHQYDNRSNLATSELLVESLFYNIKPINAVLIGGKQLPDDKEQVSMSMFRLFKENIEKRVKRLTVFGEHTYPYSETHLAYDGNTDTCTLCTMYRRPRELHKDDQFVNNLSILKECLKDIHIAKGDRLFFDGVPCEYH